MSGSPSTHGSWPTRITSELVVRAGAGIGGVVRQGADVGQVEVGVGVDQAGAQDRPGEPEAVRSRGKGMGGDLGGRAGGQQGRGVGDAGVIEPEQERPR